MESIVHGQAKLSGRIELLYTVCIGYMMITHIMHTITQLPYTGLVLLFFLVGIDAVACRRISISKRNLYILVFYGFWITLSLVLVRGDATGERALSFICFAPVAAYISEYDLNQEKTERIIRNLATVFFVFYASGLMGATLQKDYFNTSLGVLPGIFSFFIFTWNKMRQKKYISGIICMIILGGSSFSFITNCSRGAFVSYVGFIVIYILVEDTPKWIKIGGVGLLSMGIYVAFHLIEFIRWGHQILQKAGIDIRFFYKSVEKLQTSTISSHRDVLYANFFNSDLFTFLFGRGIGGYEKQFGIYTHNIILNKWSDFGVVGLIWILFVMAIAGLVIINEKMSREVFLVILGTSVFPYMFSFTYWSNPCSFLLEFLAVKYFVIMFRKRTKKKAGIYARF